MRAGLNDDTRRLERRRNVGGTPQCPLFPRDRGNLRCTVDTVLQRKHDRVVTEQGPNHRKCGGVVIGFDRDDDDVDRADAACILFRGGLCDEIARGDFGFPARVRGLRRGGRPAR